LQTKDIYFLKAPTELGAFLGCVSGIITVLVNGAINDAEGGLFEYFWLRNEGICALCGSKTMISFIVTPVISAIMTYVFTFLDLMVRGERARQPIFLVAFDKSDLETVNNDAVKDIDNGSEEDGAVSKDDAHQKLDADEEEIDA
jgi:SSS family solute:Na+ symporter